MLGSAAKNADAVAFRASHPEWALYNTRPALFVPTKQKRALLTVGDNSARKPRHARRARSNKERHWRAVKKRGSKVCQAAGHHNRRAASMSPEPSTGHRESMAHSVERNARAHHSMPQPTTCRQMPAPTSCVDPKNARAQKDKPCYAPLRKRFQFCVCAHQART